MLKDRRILLEQEIVKQTRICGILYLKIIKNEADLFEKDRYDAMKAKLSDDIADLAIIKQMILDGHDLE